MYLVLFWIAVSIFLLQQVLDLVIVATENVSISRMERLYALLSQCIYRHREDDDKTELVKVNFLSWSPLCHMLLYMCVFVWVHCEHHAYLALLFTAQLPVSQGFHFSLKDIYPYCKTFVVCSIIFGSFSRKRLEANGSTHSGLSNQLTSVCQ